MKKVKYKWTRKRWIDIHWNTTNHVDVYAKAETLEVFRKKLLALSSVLDAIYGDNDQALEPSLRVFVSIRVENSDIREINRILKGRS